MERGNDRRMGIYIVYFWNNCDTNTHTYIHITYTCDLIVKYSMGGKLNGIQLENIMEAPREI